MYTPKWQAWGGHLEKGGEIINLRMAKKKGHTETLMVKIIVYARLCSCHAFNNVLTVWHT